MNSTKGIIVDVRGSLCPKPVIETKRVVDKSPGEVITTIVDNEVSRDNVEKFGISKGYSVTIAQEGKDFYLTLVPGDMNHDDVTVNIDTLQESAHVGNRVLLMTKDYLGEGSEELGRNLMKTFWTCVVEADVKPKTIYFINSAVKMVVTDSTHLDSLKELAKAGVDIAACGICLDYYGIKDQVDVGTITNLYAITDSLMNEAVVKL